MCIIKDCPKPTTPGLWWRENDRWVLYETPVAESIKEALAMGLESVDLGVIRSATHPGGQRYMADLRSMEQYNVNSGYRRSIHVVEDDDTCEENSADETGLSKDNETPRVYYRDEHGVLRPYTARFEKNIIEALIKGNRSEPWMSPGKAMDEEIPVRGAVLEIAGNSVKDDAEATERIC